MIVARFAPSPTSDLHVGNLRTALAAWLLARRAGGRFLMRIEDLDEARVNADPGAQQRQLDDLAALGLDWDGPLIRQSERLDLYLDALNELGERVYPCFCSRKEIAQASSAPHHGARPYPGTCANLNTAQRSQRALTRPGALRVRAEQAVFTAHDRFAGDVTGVVDDFVLRRFDGAFAYHLAVVVDDGRMGINQVTRGDDLLDSAVRHAWLADQLGFVPCDYAHVSLVFNDQGQRLAKRDKAVTLSQLGDHGVTVGNLVSAMLASLGYPSGTTLADAAGATSPDFSSWTTPLTFDQRYFFAAYNTSMT